MTAVQIEPFTLPVPQPKPVAPISRRHRGPSCVECGEPMIHPSDDGRCGFCLEAAA